MLSTILFDLDGTLLPMDQDHFIGAYMGEVTKRFASSREEGERLVKALWKGIDAMLNNDGRAYNSEVFWDTFAGILGQEIREKEGEFDDFYAGEFERARAVCGENPLARACIDELRQKGYMLVCATNPVFPAVATKTRMAWVGLAYEDFVYVTDYANSRYCKPSPGYYLELLDVIGKTPQECLLVGNSLKEDMPAAALGMDTYLITDCLIDGDGSINDHKNGSFEDFVRYARSLPAVK
ncbi:MAG: HAD family hydrolase [Christensenellales bacterium]|jgi:FMN phosphatase YigB (HAD superfamily)